MLRSVLFLLLSACVAAVVGAAHADTSLDPPPKPVAYTGFYDVIVSGGLVYDGSGGSSVRADVGIRKDRIVTIGDLHEAEATTLLDARGLVVAPGFINLLSWSNKSLIIDGASQSEIRQGVTTEILGEGQSMGPLNPLMKKGLSQDQGDFPIEIKWTTLAEYLRYLENRGISPNVASFIGAATVRENVLGTDDRAPNADELDRMRELVRAEMADGALGVGSALKYAPGAYASTDELIELCKVAAQFHGTCSSHIREPFVKGTEEFLRIAREAAVPSLLHHLNSSASNVKAELEKGVALIEAARAKGLKITADAYPYTASANPLKSLLPLWAHDGGGNALMKRLREKPTRDRIRAFLDKSGLRWDSIQVAATRSEGAKRWIGKTVAEIAAAMGHPPADAVMDLLIEDRGGIEAIYFGRSEEHLQRILALPWVAFGSDAHSMAPEGVFLKSSVHPRAYGAFARVLGKYVRDEKVLALPDAIRRLTHLPAQALGLTDRGLIKVGMFADLAIFDAAQIADKATFENPHRYAVGMRHVLVNGVVVLKNGDHTGAKPGRALWGPGKITSN